MASISRRRFNWTLGLTLSTPWAVFAGAKGKTLKFNAAGKFKIVQFTDIHWRHGSENGKKILQLMESVLDAEQPDFVVLTGDIVTSKPAEKGWEAVLEPIIKRRINWAAILGNHDDEHDLGREEIISLLEKQPYSFVESGPVNIEGKGNYILKIRNRKNKDAAVLYCLDSGAYAPPPRKKNGKYAWIDPSQIEWYRKNSLKITKANHGRPLPSLAFFHIPLPEFNDAWESKTPAPIGSKGEKVCCPRKNTGLFSAMVKNRDVMGVFVGHDHVNDYAGVVDGICLAYGRKAGLDTYGRLPLCARMIELASGKREFDSWIRTADGEIHHKIQYPTSFVETAT